MKTLIRTVPVMLLALCFASTSWAGGAFCNPDGAKASAKSASAGSRCSGKDGAAATASKECGVKANQVMYSFAVPSAECGHCVDAIQKAAMGTKGVHCAHVDLSTRTAYIIADKKVSERHVSHVITEAGFKNKLSSKGSKAQAAFAKAMVSGDKSTACCARSKDRV